MVGLEGGTLSDLGVNRVGQLMAVLGLDVPAPTTENRLRKQGLKMAARTANVSYASELTAGELARVLVSGEVPATYAAQMAHLLDEAPPAMVVMAVEEAAIGAQMPPRRIWRNVAKMANTLLLTARTCGCEPRIAGRRLAGAATPGACPHRGDPAPRRHHRSVLDVGWRNGTDVRHRHRLSKDIDIFVPNPQYLGFVTPRLSDVAASLTGDYSEDPSAWVKLQFEEGEVDSSQLPIFSMTPGRNGRSMAGAYAWNVGGIIAKKMFHRGHRTTARDLFDLALVIEREPDALAAAADALVRHRSTFLDQIRNPHPTLKIAFKAIDTLD